MKSLLTIATICGLANLAFSQNFGIDIPSPTRKLEVNGDIKLSPGYQVYFGENVTTTGKIGLNFHTDGDPNYGIYKPAGAWTQPLHIGFYTGVKIGANSGYGGTKFYNSSDMATEIMSIGNGDNHVRINNYLFSQYVNTTDNVVSSGVTGIMVKAGDNYYRTANAAAIQAFIGSSGADNLGNHSATTTLSMNNNAIVGFGRLEPSGVGGNSGQGDNPYAIFQEGGAWSHPYPDLRIAYHTGIKLGANSSYNGIRFYNDYNMATQTFSVGDGDNNTRFYYDLMAGGNTVIDAGGGWHRSYGQTGWYNGTYGGGWWMTDGSYVRTYNPKPITWGLGSDQTAAVWGGYNYGNSTSDGHRLLSNSNAPGSTGWGFVGQPNTDWWYMYSDNFTNTSTRGKKRDILPLDDNLMAYVMKDIEKMKPSFYKYKSESDELVPGFETRYRPNMHLGVVLDETPDYLQDNAFSGVDIYAMGVFALTGVKYQQKQIKELSTNTAVGRASMTANTITVQFPSGFCKNGEVPVVNITPTSANTGFYLSAADSKSFTVTAASPLSFNWQAVRSTNDGNRNEVTPAIDSKLASQLVVDQSKKDNIQGYWRKNKEKLQAEYQDYLDGLKAGDPVQYERLMEENKLAEKFAATSGKSGGYNVEAMHKKSEAEAKRRVAEMAKVNQKSNSPDPTKVPEIKK